MVYVKRWVRWLLIALSIYAAIALYGVLRPLGLDPIRSLFICSVYGIGFFKLIAIFISMLRSSR